MILVPRIIDLLDKFLGSVVHFLNQSRTFRLSLKNLDVLKYIFSKNIFSRLRLKEGFICFKKIYKMKGFLSNTLVLL